MPGDTSSAPAAHAGPPGASGPGKRRTDMNCTECGKLFIAEVDFSVEGPHVIECPHCAHEHLRQVRAGVITDERWGSRPQRAAPPHRDSVWKSDVGKTSTASAFIRDLWLNRADVVKP